MGGFDDELARRRDAASAMGGAERLARREAEGRLDARARVARLLDPGSFHELGTLAGTLDDIPADALVAGHGTIDGRPVLVGAEDATVLGGSIGIAGAAKRERLARLAGQERVPLVLLLDGAGHRATNALVRRGPAPTDLAALADLSGRVPVLVGVLGASAGHGALAAPLADVVVMVEGHGQLFTAGPPLVRAATGEDVDKETLGGWAVQGSSGVAHLAAPDDGAALDLLRHVLGYLPLNAWEHPPVGPESAPPSGSVAALIPDDDRRPYDIHPVLAAVLDADSVLELGAPFGDSIVTALARLAGHPVAVVANQPLVRAGAIDERAAAKATRFVELAASFHLPLVLIADNPGVLPGTAAERAGVLRAAARLYAAQHRHPGPKLHVTLRKAYGFGSSLMAQNPFDGQTLTLALPGASVGAMPARPGAGASGADADTTESLEAAERGGAWRLADQLSYDEVVVADELRARLAAALLLALRGRRTAPAVPVARFGHLP